jgi:hypothetical protein
MYLLKTLNIAAILYVIFMIFSWQPSQPTSPREAFATVKTAYENNNAEKLTKLLTKESKLKILKIIDKIKRMPDSSKIVFAKKFGLNPSKLSALTIKDYLAIQFFINKDKQKNERYHFSKLSISNISENKQSAVITTNQHLKLHFIKEGAYWFYNLEAP